MQALNVYWGGTLRPLIGGALSFLFQIFLQILPCVGLDVYKRQRLCVRRFFLPGAAGCATLRRNCTHGGPFMKRIASIQDISCPVSYTHLDVYKRQVFILASAVVGIVFGF